MLMLFFSTNQLFQLTFEFPTTCFAGQTLLHLGKLRVPCRDVANPTGLQHSLNYTLNSCIRLHRVAIVATVAKDCMHSAPSTDLDVDSLLEVSRQRPLMAAIDGSRVVASTRWTDLVSDLRQTFDHKRNHIDVAVSAKGFQPMNLDRFAYKGSLGVPCSIRWRIHQGLHFRISREPFLQFASTLQNQFQFLVYQLNSEIIYQVLLIIRRSHVTRQSPCLHTYHPTLRFLQWLGRWCTRNA